MAKKTVRKKKSSPAPGRAKKKPAAKRNAKPTNSGCYVAVSSPAVSTYRTKPKSGTAAGPCDDFEQAKSAALDGLISAIEDAERKLAACKRATTIEQLKSL